MELLLFTLDLQEHTWIVFQLDQYLQHLIVAGISSVKTLKTLGTVRNYIQKARTSTCTPLLSQIDAYYKAWLMPSFSIDSNVIQVIEALITLWKQDSNESHRELAVLLADLPLTSYRFRCDCLGDITILGTTWIMSALEALKLQDGNPDLGCFSLIKLLALEDRLDILERWRQVLSFAIDKQSEKLLQYALTNQSTNTWLELLGKIRVVYDESEMITQRQSRGLLCPQLHSWSQKFAHYLPEMMHLETLLRHRSAMHPLLLGSSSSKNNSLLRVLGLLRNDNVGVSRSDFHKKVMDPIIELLSFANVEQIEDVLSVVLKASCDGAKACLRVLESLHHVSSGMTEVMLASSLRGGASEADRLALKKVAGLFGITLDAEEYPSASGLKEAADSLHNQYLSLITEAQRLESLRLSVQRVDHTAVSDLLVRLHIEAPSAVDDALSSLPPSLGSLFAKRSTNELELQFPAINLTKMQRFAIGASETEYFLVRLALDHEGKPTKFCIHLSADLRTKRDQGHTSWEVFRGNRPPYEQYCHGRPNRGVYQLSRILWHHLRHHNFVSLEQTYAYMTLKLSKFGQGCMVCGRGQCRLRRATICPSASCGETFSKAHIEIQLAELWRDPPVMDLLLSMIYAAASTKNLDLQTVCSASIAPTIVSMLNSLPEMATMAKDLKLGEDANGHDRCLSQILAADGPESSDFALLRSVVLRVCSSYRGFLISATGSLRIPSFGKNQFLLANMAPDLELGFSRHMPTPQSPSHILFHGTSLDRLHAILYQGLREQSNTAYQRHGTMHGPGIYLADEPGVALGYATVSSGGWKSSKLKRMQVLLGCELAGSKPQAPSKGIYVITDPTRLAVRYIFLLPSAARMPAAKDVRPPMASVFHGLRNGTL